jgi:hydrogenase nickel incorporation protein HypA/HybF
LHEVGITQSIVEIAERNAREQGAVKVLSVTVEIGDLSGVMADAVEFCFDACTAGTFLDGTALVIRRIAGKGKCRDCQAETPLQPFTFACSACGGYALDVLQGDELRITEMEID